MSLYLSFYFDKNDESFTTDEVIINSKPGNYISHAFIKTNLYDNLGKKIGYQISDEYIQQLDGNKKKNI